MKEKIEKVISQVVTMSREDIDVLLEKRSAEVLKRHEKFIEIGQQNSKVGFLNSGLLRSYYFDDNGNEQTTAFMEPGFFFRN